MIEIWKLNQRLSQPYLRPLSTIPIKLVIAPDVFFDLAKSLNNRQTLYYVHNHENSGRKKISCF